ncbi:helix-turn-helix domain-containing protein [Streptomyces pseudovenezuelae]|uniref:Transcriptional regulator with XRE-family HTH domain n=1 Tax=Streptomyces pseudovenezuelae TaxID=67350 RepID=A0ABT6LXQ6_9ACTN|nr:helix-turn-helix domain-containing protein [Streptomyces pseudovenezuelae]MDH6221079.1 transcriptional regulator with XRE-family HTH domain [Streptomyces pseudovenezuelae]
MDPRPQIQEFLVSRRAKISPQSVGLPVAGRKRRVPGLRREEVAALAGLSVDYYIRLERGALTNASDSVLNAIARALQLDATEQAHLIDLARAGKPSAAPARSRRTPPAAMAPQLQTILDALVGVPALVRSPTLDIVAANLLARALYSPVYTDTDTAPNLARFTFLNPDASRFWRDWDRVADDLTAHLRTAAGATPYDRALTDLVGELSTRSDAFRQLWARHDVRAYGRGTKHFHHPVVGELDLRYDLLQPAAEPGLTMITYTAEPGTASHDNLSLLASWAASQGSTAPDRASSTRHVTPPTRQE